MKLSQLRSLCDKAIEKYGDINVGTYDKNDAHEIENENDMCDFKFRVLWGAGGLPGVTVDDDEESSESPAGHYACMFYADYRW
jgi:hypothetical protein